MMLKRIFFWNNKNLDDLLHAEFDGSLVDSKEFHNRIRQERLRSDRSGLPLSLVVIDLHQLIQFITQNNPVSPRRLLSQLANILQNSTRESDTKGWYNPGNPALLAPDTNKSGARILVANLTGSFLRNSDLVDHYHEQEVKRFITILTYENTQNHSWPPSRGSGGKDEKGAYRSLNLDHHPSKSEIDEGNNDYFSLQTTKRYHVFVKRLIDIVLSIILIILSSPILLLCTLLIKLDSPGQVLYRQKRVGKDGKTFIFFKFRSMYHKCDENIHKQHIKNLRDQNACLISNGPNDEMTYKLADDDRITRFGQLLRKTSIDELPQLLNVLRGDMSLVGPRPHPVYEVELYAPWQRRRLAVKPGITGLGQVNGRYNKYYHDVFRLDCRYLKGSPLFEDFKILLKTIPAVFGRKGAV